VSHLLPAPTDEELAPILEQIHDRLTRLPRRCGRLPEDQLPHARRDGAVVIPH
jgi:hypothetical protein